MWCVHFPQAPLEVTALYEALQSLGMATSVVDALADRFMTADFVKWSDIRDAHVAGRDIIRLRQHLRGKVPVLFRSVNVLFD